MVDDALLSNNDSVVPMVYVVFRLKTQRMSCLSTPLFDTRLIGLEVPDLAQSVIEIGAQPYEDYWVLIEDHPLSVSWEEYLMYSYLDKSLIRVI